MLPTGLPQAAAGSRASTAPIQMLTAYYIDGLLKL